MIGLALLRRALHLGLVEEAAEVEIGPPIVCANCGAPTARHTFCGNCGIALQRAAQGSRGRARLRGRAAARAPAHRGRAPAAGSSRSSSARSWPAGWACSWRCSRHPASRQPVCRPGRAVRGAAGALRKGRRGKTLATFPGYTVWQSSALGLLAALRLAGVADHPAGAGRRAAADAGRLRGARDRRACPQSQDVARRRSCSGEASAISGPDARLRGRPQRRRSAARRSGVGLRPGVGGVFDATGRSPQAPQTPVAVAIESAADGHVSIAAVVITPAGDPQTQAAIYRRPTTSSTRSSGRLPVSAPAVTLGVRGVRRGRSSSPRSRRSCAGAAAAAARAVVLGRRGAGGARCSARSRRRSGSASRSTSSCPGSAALERSLAALENPRSPAVPPVHQRARRSARATGSPTARSRRSSARSPATACAWPASYPQRTALRVSATVATVRRLFGVAIARFADRVGDALARAARSAPAIPRALAAERQRRRRPLDAPGLAARGRPVRRARAARHRTRLRHRAARAPGHPRPGPVDRDRRALRLRPQRPGELRARSSGLTGPAPTVINIDGGSPTTAGADETDLDIEVIALGRARRRTCSSTRRPTRRPASPTSSTG